MRKYEKKVVTEKRTVEVHLECDKCRRPSRRDDDPAWVGRQGSTQGDVRDFTLICCDGVSDIDGSGTTRTRSVDLCVDCREDLFVLLAANGYRVNSVEVDF